MKILIIGAGPVGCYTAQLLKRIGLEPIILEEHSKIGKPVQCAGIVSSKLLSMTKTFVSDNTIINRINKFYISSPWVEDFAINVPGIACVLNREKFDLDMGKNLDIRLGQHVSVIEKDNNGYILKTSNGDIFKTDILIGADGPDSIVRKYMLTMSGKKNIIPSIKYYFGMQYQILLDNNYPVIPQDIIKVYFDNDITFFLWLISENTKILRIGVVAENAKNILDSFMINKNIKGKIIDVIAGKISLGLIPTYYENIALVGDAACQLKPLTGGGLSYGLQSAAILVNCIKNENLDKYDFRWKDKFGKEIAFGIKARNIYEGFEAKQKKEVFNIFKNNSDFIEKVIDFDNHSLLFKEAFKNPKLLLDASKLLGYYISEIIK